MNNENMKLPINPEFENMIPDLTDDELSQLEENILLEGRIVNPIVVWNGVIVPSECYRNHVRVEGIHQNRGRRTQIRGFPISKQDKGVFHYTPITATGNAVREI